MTKAKKIIPKRLGEVLIARGLITEVQLEEALTQQKQNKSRLIGEILVELRYITEEAIAWALTVMYGYPYLPLENYTIDKESAQIIPKDIATKYHVVAIDRIGTILTTVMANPLDDDVVKKIEDATQCKIRLFICTMTEINKILRKHYAQS